MEMGDLGINLREHNSQLCFIVSDVFLKVTEFTGGAVYSGEMEIRDG